MVVQISTFRILLGSKKISSVVPKNFQSTFKTYKLESQLFKKILTDELSTLSNVFKKNNFELRIAGGAVRDLVMNILPHDIDLATNALPNQMIQMFNQENIRIINLNGLKHGTVPVRINDKQNFEITTLRIDVKTYGRHAEVEFTNDWHKDAIRRDLTVNSLFLDFEGVILDYVNGMYDIKNKIVRFVGVPDKRVKEDYLRILRYFRFYSRVKDDCNDHHKESLEAIRNNADGLEIISGQRIGHELRLILSQKFSDSFMKIFYDFNLASHMGMKINFTKSLPENGNVNKYQKVYQNFLKNKIQPIVLLAALMSSEDDVKTIIGKLDQRIRLSNEERHLLIAIKRFENIFNEFDSDEKQFVLPKSVHDRPLRKTEAFELMKYLDRIEMIETIKKLKIPEFKINYKMINEQKIFDSSNQEMITVEKYSKTKKIRLSAMLLDLKLRWINSNFAMSEDDILGVVDESYI
ncbi:CCA tRNA nucleotidyltransferase mitochondrial [Brachionus plicatilis]|uniref:CCA tRNA nucleotidyltransferase mitochondrial n=1 Tax=Brachionus plicatilis TaxID=10195 RepID=A0A3M7P8G9_BRAPC|nr:CCA tRNA nucleotidyltransferase mitochondrial [Brachionus plicatilis]